MCGSCQKTRANGGAPTRGKGPRSVRALDRREHVGHPFGRAVNQGYIAEVAGLQLSRGAGLNPDHPINESHAGLFGGWGEEM